jgi:exopolysaccharide biosynthesis polyprenyl glycosylphosphotransferase
MSEQVISSALRHFQAPSTVATADSAPIVLSKRQHWGKRALDVALVGLLLLLCLPTLVIIAIAVRISSPGPILFRQTRIGRDGASFTLLKFRTMSADSGHQDHEAYYKALVNGQAQPIGNTFKLRNDPRITPIGRLLRRFSLDELPQFINVLRGDMSLVGPRPPLPYEVELYGAREYRRLAVVPGLSGLWQVSGRSGLDFQQMVTLDLEYIDNWSLWMDVQILARTPLVVLTGYGAC